MASVNRRSVLIGAGALAGVASFLGVGAVLSDRGDALRQILERLIGRFEMKQSDFDQFVADLAGTPAQPSEGEADIIRLAEATGMVPTLIANGMPMADKLEALERALLTEFALATNLADGQKPQGQLQYDGLFKARPCANPFAVFDT